MAIMVRYVVPYSRILLFLFLVMLVLQQLQARPIHYGVIDDVGLNECDRLDWTGEIQASLQCYRRILAERAEPLIRAEATWALGDIKGANTLFQSAVQTAPDNPLVRLRWGDLFMETYQYQDAFELFQEALALAPENSFALLGAARALVERFESDARKYIDAVLELDDAAVGARYQATLLLARMAMEATDFDAARDLLEDAATLAQSAGLPELEIYALHSSMELLTGAGPAPWIQRALDENPAYGDIYAIPGYFFWISRRYREAIKLFEQAIAIEPGHWIAHMELGINLLRDNQVSRSRQHLEIAYGGDPYNPKTVNTLRLLDTFDEYDLLNSPAEPPADGFPRAVFRLHRDESQVLFHYAQQLTEQGIREFSARYRFEPKEPVVVEIYPNHDDFVVRTIGMPGVGILGAAFGYVFAMDSPSDHPDNEYHWGTTLWHELAHVFTLNATDNLIPRWYSEGLSVYEEWRYGPIRGMRIPVNVLTAMAEDKFLPIAELDGGFIRPSYNEQVIVSYMQAGLVCEYIDREFGFAQAVNLLDAFRRGLDTTTAIESTLGISTGEFDEGFAAFVEAEFGDLLGQLDHWKHLHETATKQLSESEWQAAARTAKLAIEIFPEYVESDSPWIFLASAQSRLGQEDAELDTLMQFWQYGGYTPEALWLLANKLYQRDERVRAIEVLSSLNLVDPFDLELHQTLGDWMMEDGDYQSALSEYQAALSMQPHDMADAYFHVARANHLLNQHEQARKNVLSALEIAPHYRPAQKLLLETTRIQQ